MNEVRMRVPDISCGHCVAAVENALKQLEGVEEVHVSLETKSVKVRAINELTSADLLGAIRDAGYTPELEK